MLTTAPLSAKKELPSTSLEPLLQLEIATQAPSSDSTSSSSEAAKGTEEKELSMTFIYSIQVSELEV